MYKTIVSNVFVKCARRVGFMGTQAKYKGTFQSRMFEYIVNESAVVKPTLLQGHLNTENTRKSWPAQNDVPLCTMLEQLDSHYAEEGPQIFITNPLYKNCIKQLKTKLSSDELNKKVLVKLLFYIGLQKNAPDTQNLVQLVLRRLKDRLFQMSLMDMCILSNVLFKTRIKLVDKTFIRSIETILKNHSHQVFTDTEVLVCLTKVLRQNQQFDYNFLYELCLATEQWATSFVVKSHVLALLAEARYYEDNAMAYLTTTGLEDLRVELTKSVPKSRRDYMVDRPRVKHIAKFLWSLSMLGVQLSKGEVGSVVLPLVLRRLQDTKELTREPDVLLDCMLSLCIMGHYSKQLLSWVTESKIQQQFSALGKTQPWSQLQLLVDACNIEGPYNTEKLSYNGPVLPGDTVDNQLRRRPPLRQLYTVISCLHSSVGIEPPVCSFQIPSLYIAGIILTKRTKTIHLELLDASVCLHNSTNPIGIMKLKLRLLERSKQLVVQVHYQTIPEEETAKFLWIEDFLNGLFNK